MKIALLLTALSLPLMAMDIESNDSPDKSPLSIPTPDNELLFDNVFEEMASDVVMMSTTPDECSEKTFKRMYRDYMTLQDLYRLTLDRCNMYKQRSEDVWQKFEKARDTACLFKDKYDVAKIRLELQQEEIKELKNKLNYSNLKKESL